MPATADGPLIPDLAPVPLPGLAGCLHGLRAGVTTRTDSLPLGGDTSFTTGARDQEAIRANRAAWLASIGSAPERAVLPALVHGTRVQAVTRADAGRGVAVAETAVRATDGLTTDTPGLTLMLCFADCVPLVVVDPHRRAIGLAHAGWRGTLAGMATALVVAMRATYGSVPEALIAVIGPSIGPEAYEVGDEVAQPFAAAYPDDGLLRSEEGRWYLDLWAANRAQFARAGVPQPRIFTSGICTLAQGDRFFSHRYALRHREIEGRFAVMLALEG